MKKYIFIAIGLLFAVLAIIFLSGKSPSGKPFPISVTPIPTTIPPPTSPTSGQLGSYGKLLEKIKNRPTIAISDAKIRSELINSLLGKSGTIYTTPQLQVDYIKTPDVFQVKILTSDVDGAKQNAVKWFQSKGLSLEGVCNLPAMFYLDFSILKQYPNLKNSLNPLPLGC